MRGQHTADVEQKVESLVLEGSGEGLNRALGGQIASVSLAAKALHCLPNIDVESVHFIALRACQKRLRMIKGTRLFDEDLHEATANSRVESCYYGCGRHFTRCMMR